MNKIWLVEKRELKRKLKKTDQKMQRQKPISVQIYNNFLSDGYE